MSRETNVLTGPEETIHFPEGLNFGRYLLGRLIAHGSRVAQINADTDERQTYRQIVQRSVKLAVYLSREGLQADDRVAICSENNLSFCVPVCAALYLGATCAPLNPMYSEREFAHALGISRPRYIFVSRTVAARLKEVVRGLDWAPKLVSLVDCPEGDLPSCDSLTSRVSEQDVQRFRPRHVNANTHILAILCSSGTTGLPKGVMLTDRNVFCVLKYYQNPEVINVNADTVLLGLLPFFHAYAFIRLTLELAIGSTTVVLSRFEPEHFLGAIQKYKIQNLLLVPPLMVFLAKHPLVDRYDLSSVKQIWCGAAPLSQDILATVSKRLRVPDIRQGYGLTETTLAVVLTPKDGHKIGSVGTLVPGISAKVIPIGEDGVGRNLGPNTQGELCFKGDLIMKGYCGDVSSTAATIDRDGWLHTGDVGYYDEEGYFYIVDRSKELIKYKGFQVPPAELEAILLTHPGIKDAAVVGLADEAAGELPLAFVVKQTGAKVSAEEIVKYVNDRVSAQKRLRGGVRFLEDIPKTPSGKILRRHLRDMLKSKL